MSERKYQPNRILCISQEQLSNPQRRDLIELECAMLYPKDEARRLEAERTARVQADREETLDGTTVRGLVDSAAEALPLRVIRSDLVKVRSSPVVWGMLSGEVLLLALMRAHRDAPDAYMKRVIADVASWYESLWEISAKSIENRVWSTFRSVAHYWAAHVYLKFHRVPGFGDNLKFPCPANRMATFLAFAESLRRLGEATRLRQAPSTILRVHESVRLPDRLVLPQVQLDFTITKAA